MRKIVVFLLLALALSAVSCLKPQHRERTRMVDKKLPLEIIVDILSEPFNFGFSAFLADLNTCDELIIVGYSFSDPHINSVIGTNLNKNISSMTIVDFKKGNDISDIELKLAMELNLIHKFNLQSDNLYQNIDGSIRIHTGGFCNYLKDTL